MPIYMCNAVRDIIPETAKPKIAADITTIHCDVTGAPPTFVHAFFFEDAPQQPLNGKSVFLFGNIRAGRTRVQMQTMINRMRQSIHTHAGVPLDEIIVDTTDVPASWVMEGGDLLPEPGDEKGWLKAYDTANG
ncbi:MAG: hypothetical protein AAGA21_21215 [Pseudomonadota bacterium]